MFVFVLSLVLPLLAACSDEPAEGGNELSSAPPTSSISETSQPDMELPSTSSDNNIRDTNYTTELIGNPERIIQMINEVEIVFDAGSLEYESIIEILNKRMPGGFAEAASYFAWVDEDTGNTNWSFMAQDFDYLRLCYDNIQTVKINCMREGYEGYTPELSFHDITFPLTESELSGSTEMCIIGSSTFFGILENSAEILSTLLTV